MDAATPAVADLRAPSVSDLAVAVATPIDLDAPAPDLATVAPPDLGATDAGPGCATFDDCPEFQACDATGRCTVKCDDAHLCNAGCCNSGVCADGESVSACGLFNSCADCRTFNFGFSPVCITYSGQAYCGCASANDCPPGWRCGDGDRGCISPR